MGPTNDAAAPDLDRDIAAVLGGVAYVTDIRRRLVPYFERAAPRQRALADVRNLLSPAAWKNSWQLAEISGNAAPHAFQHLLRPALWDPEAVRDELRRYAIQHLWDSEAVLVIGETDVLKKGYHSAGASRQYSSTAGNVEHCHIGVFLSAADPAHPHVVPLAPRASAPDHL